MFANLFRSELDEPVARELDAMRARLKGFLLTEHNEDGTHNFNPGGDTNAAIQQIIDGYQKNGQWWKRGPWLLNDPTGDTEPNRAILRPTDPAAGTYNDYAPAGIDTAVGMSIEPLGNIIITGIKAYDERIDQDRLFFLRNRDSSSSITLTHEDVLSLEAYRFDLPNSEDVVIGPKQNVWLYYDPDRERWTFTITANVSGGLAGAGGAASSNALLDGTNHTDTVAQAVTRGSLIYGNSTPKWDELPIGAAARVLRSDGTDAAWSQVNLTTDVTGVLPAANGGSQLITVSVALSEAEIETANSVPKTLVSAQGANTVIIPISFSLIINTTDAYTSNPTFSIQYAGRNTNLTSANAMGLSGVNTVIGLEPFSGFNPLDITVFDVRDKGIVFKASADPTGVGAATGRIILSYYVISSFSE